VKYLVYDSISLSYFWLFLYIVYIVASDGAQGSCLPEYEC
jgi:hypothetical protein